MINSRQVKFGNSGNFASLFAYANKMVVKQIPFVATQVITIGGSPADVFELDSTILPGNLSIGANTTYSGGIVAQTTFAIGTGATDKVVDSLGNITNLVKLRNPTTKDPINYNDKEVFGLIQTDLMALLSDGHPIGATGLENTQISFVVVAADGTLSLASLPAGTAIEFSVNKAFANRDLPAYEFQGGNVSPDIIAPEGTAQVKSRYVVTTAFVANEVINFETGAGGTAGVASVTGTLAGFGASGAVMNADQTLTFTINGVEQLKGVDIVWDSATTAHFALALDVGDWFEVTGFKVV